MKLPRFQNSESGFTFIEIIISVGLLMLVFAFYDQMVQTVVFTNRGRFDDIGRSVAVEQLEVYRATDFNLLTDGTFTVSDPDLNYLPQGAGTVTVADYGSADSGIKQVTAVVSWLDRGVTRDVTLTTLTTSGGVGK